MGKYVPRTVTRRITAQEACFTVHKNVDRELDQEYLSEIRHEWKIDEFVVPSKVKEQMRYSLFRIGIHQESLFPDEDGVGGHLDWKYTQANPIGVAEDTDDVEE